MKISRTVPRRWPAARVSTPSPRTKHEAGNNGASDDVQLADAAAQGRVMVTRNADDVCSLTNQFQVEGRRHSGLLLVPPSLQGDQHRRIGHAIVAYDRAHPNEIPPYTVDWLRP
jgi:hypothetical protein